MSVAWGALGGEREQENFVDLTSIPRVYVSGVAYVRIINGLIHRTYFIKRPCQTGIENVLECELMMPIDGFRAGGPLIRRAFDDAGFKLEV